MTPFVRGFSSKEKYNDRRKETQRKTNGYNKLGELAERKKKVEGYGRFVRGESSLLYSCTVGHRSIIEEKKEQNTKQKEKREPKESE